MGNHRLLNILSTPTALVVSMLLVLLFSAPYGRPRTSDGDITGCTVPRAKAHGLGPPQPPVRAAFLRPLILFLQVLDSVVFAWHLPHLGVSPGRSVLCMCTFRSVLRAGVVFYDCALIAPHLLRALYWLLRLVFGVAPDPCHPRCVTLL